MAPEWIPLPPEHEKYVDDVLKYWEARSNEIDTYKCGFQRWDYDPVFGHREKAKTFSEGVMEAARAADGWLIHG